jgi:hypothetical protein
MKEVAVSKIQILLSKRGKQSKGLAQLMSVCAKKSFWWLLFFLRRFACIKKVNCLCGLRKLPFTSPVPALISKRRAMHEWNRNPRVVNSLISRDLFRFLARVQPSRRNGDLQSSLRVWTPERATSAVLVSPLHLPALPNLHSTRGICIEFLDQLDFVRRHMNSINHEISWPQIDSYYCPHCFEEHMPTAEAKLNRQRYAFSNLVEFEFCW